MKKKILMITSWYPSIENSIRGGFFQERANLFMERYDVLVVNVEQEMVLPNGIENFIKAFLKKPQVIKDFLLTPPDSLKFTCYGLKDNFFLKLLPEVLFNKIKKFNHRKLQKTYEFAYEFVNEKNNFIPDLIYAASIQTCGSFAYHLRKKNKVPYVLSEHSNFHISALNRYETREALETANGIIGISNDKIRQILFCNVKCRPVFIGNLVDETRFKIENKNCYSNEKKILIVASYTWMKDYDTFFDTIELLKVKSICKFRVRIVGIGKKNLMNVEEQLMLRDIHNLCEIIPEVSRDEMPSIYNDSDVLVLTSIAEGMPNACLEAMACGIPVFSTRCGGVEDVINFENGRLVSLQESEELSNQLVDFINEKIKFDANTIRESVIKDYGRKAYLEKMSLVFDSAIFSFKDV